MKIVSSAINSGVFENVSYLLFTHTQTRTLSHTHAHMHTYAHIHTHTHIHTHIHTHTQFAKMVRWLIEQSSFEKRNLKEKKKTL